MLLSPCLAYGASQPVLGVRCRLPDRTVLLSLWQQRDLQTLEDGSLLRITNHAVAAYAHGTLRHGDETDDIGGLF